MAEERKMRCWIVPTHWTCGALGLSVVYAVDEAGAGGLAVMQTMRADPAPTGDLTHILPREVTIPMLRQMLSILESGKPQSAAVLSLVPAAAPEGAGQVATIGEELARLHDEGSQHDLPDPPLDPAPAE